jgi:hypothetical protein
MRSTTRIVGVDAVSTQDSAGIVLVDDIGEAIVVVDPGRGGGGA